MEIKRKNNNNLIIAKMPIFADIFLFFFPRILSIYIVDLYHSFHALKMSEIIFFSPFKKIFDVR